MSAEEIDRLLAEGQALQKRRQYDEALAKFEQALIVDEGAAAYPRLQAWVRRPAA